MIKEIPILFSTAMVQAILEGRKTQTRRLVNLTDLVKAPDRFRYVGNSNEMEVPREAIKYDDRVWYQWELTCSNQASWVERCRWKKRDLLWVRENFRVNSWMPEDGEVNFRYEADGATSPYIWFEDGDDGAAFNKYWEQSCADLERAGYEPNDEERYAEYDYKALRLRPNIFLPKEAARIWLQVTDVRVERLRDISEEDAIAEGLACLSKDGGRTYKYGIPDSDGLPGIDDHGWPWQEWEVDPVAAFKKLWCKINGLETWESWVWVESFTVLSTTGKPDLQTT